MEDPRIISALFIFLKMAYYNVLINTHFHQQILFMLVKTSLCSVIHIVITEEWY